MSGETGGMLDVTLGVAKALLLLAFVLAFGRAVRGPTLPDRVVALDFAASLVVAAVGIFAIQSDRSTMLGIALAIGLLSFLATTAFAWYVERGGRP
ncbi:Na(+)/H(+) antiporter subunit F1 [Myxococcaceae bacterium]|jgi:multicomponent Na+:H+ antiporter subunit F|nr:Na(+)/H(+) antiporter subunit F1 [Myxococcaceae bacterium]